MANSRRHFRYDVILPMHLEMVDRYGKHVGADRRQLISEEEEQQLRNLNLQLNSWLDKVFDASSNALYVFYVLNHRMNFMWWMIEHLMEVEDPRRQHDYRFRLKEDAKFSPPSNRKNSAIAPLILGLYEQISRYIFELHEVVNTSVDGKIFKYTAPSPALFDDKYYVTNLDKLAETGVLPAKVLKLMVDKINLQASVYERLKDAFRGISNPDDWMNFKVNLSAGGFSFLSVDPYDKFSCMDVFMDIDGDEPLICRGKIVSLIDSHDELYPYRIGVEFDLLTVEQEQAITLFEQKKELRDAIQAVDLPS